MEGCLLVLPFFFRCWTQRPATHFRRQFFISQYLWKFLFPAYLVPIPLANTSRSKLICARSSNIFKLELDSCLFSFCRWTSLAMWHCSRAVARSRSCWCISVSSFVSVSPNWTSPSFGETSEKQPLCLASWKEDPTWMNICKVWLQCRPRWMPARQPVRKR